MKSLSTSFKRFAVMAAFLIVSLATFAQVKVQGLVVNEEHDPVIGATVTVKGTSTSTATDLDGKFTLTVPSDDAILVISFIGYHPKEVAANSPTLKTGIELTQNNEVLDEVVVIGYGTQRKEDLTGSITSVNAKDFNQGFISTPEELINGKIAGVQITNNGGSPNDATTIRIRGGASLNASNDPLIVIDGMPMEVGGYVTGAGNFLSLINPNDIESMTILKDASATAIYGSRASNGVILITTKKGGSSDIQVSFQTTNSLSHKTKTPGHLTPDQLREMVGLYGTAAQQEILGDANTDWYDEIYRTAFSSDNNLSIGGRFTTWFPFRVAIGATHQEGILKTDQSNRYTANINLTPNFLDDHLKISLSGKGTYVASRYGNTSAVYNAFAFDPTQPVYGTYDANGDQWLYKDGTPLFHGFREVVDSSGEPGQGAIANPLGLLMLNENRGKVWRLIGNADIDYNFHWVEGLKLHLGGGYDYSHGKRYYYIPMNSFDSFREGGRNYVRGPNKNYNSLFTVYANYNRDFESIKSTIDVTFGYDYQYWKYIYDAYDELNEAGDVVKVNAAEDQRHTLISYYGRLNYTFDRRYLLTVTFRRDGSSRFAKNNRWGTFPSVALAWRVSQEKFWQNIQPVMNDFKVRVSYGVTGQQDGIANYAYIPNYTPSQPGADYWMDGEWVTTFRPEAYNSDLKWETSKTWNFGIDYGFLNNRIWGTIDYYNRRTHDLLATVPIPAGINFDKTMLTNVGNIESNGFEFAINADIITTKDWSWTASFNATWSKTKVTNLSLVPGTDVSDTYVGSMESYGVQVFKTGYAPYTYRVYKQIYDEETGRPIEGMYADLNNDGQINDDDRYYYHSPHPDWILGLSTSLRWKKWTLSTSLRAQLNNYVYNGNAAQAGAWDRISWNAGQLNNLSDDFLNTRFMVRRYESDYYIQNGSFLKMDNLQLSYDFGKVYKSLNLHISAMIQNVFTITKYTGVDPEQQWGIDRNTYPRPRTYSLTVGLNF